MKKSTTGYWVNHDIVPKMKMIEDTNSLQDTQILSFDEVDMVDIVFLHGFISSSKSRKIGHFKQTFPKSKISDIISNYHALELYPTPTDFENMTISGLVEKIGAFIRGNGVDVILCGSSHGGLLALATYAKYPKMVRGLVLLAPSFNSYTSFRKRFDYDQWRENGYVEFYNPRIEQNSRLNVDYLIDSEKYQKWEGAEVPTLVIHGKSDDVTPIAESRNYASSNKACTEFYPPDGQHNLNNVLDLVTDTMIAWIEHHFGQS